MAQSSTMEKKSETSLPPEERFWKRYSAHHEAPLSGVVSFVLHGFVIGVLVLAAMFLTQRREAESRPVTIDVVQLEGDGTGPEGGGGPGEPGPSGPANKAARTENVFGNKETEPNKVNQPQAPSFEKVQDQGFDVPQIQDSGPIEIDDSLKAIANDARAAVHKAIRVAGSLGDPQGGKNAGRNGSGGMGDGPGKGNKTGPGTGQGGTPGRKRTRAEIFAQRWRFELEGSGKQHADKLAAAGVVLVVPDPSGKLLVIRDLRRRPVEPRAENLDPFKDAVLWENRKPQSTVALARELRLKWAPPIVFLLLPKDREQLMADAEQAYAEKTGRALNTVTETWFDFQLRDGGFQPVVIRQK
jgi:hypothetical protein